MSETIQQEWDDILGYGKKIRVLTGGSEKDGVIVPIYQELHLTPVPLSQYSQAQELVAKFFDLIGGESQLPVDGKKAADKKNLGVWPEAARNIGAEIVEMSLKKLNPSKDKKWILENVSAGALAVAISVVLDVSDFLAGMGAITAKVAVLKGATHLPALKTMTNG